MLLTLIWLIQILHYPSFKFIDQTQFVEFESFHTSRITLIVGPLMVLELILAALLFINDMNFIFGLNLILVILIWLITFFISVPLHQKLIKGYDLTTIEKLCRTNWYRTLIWSLKWIISLAVFLVAYLKGVS
jgi:hypothetical protein